MGTISQKIFCAFCRLERRVIIKKGLSWSNVLLSFMGAALFMLAIWREFDARAVMFFVCFMAIAEVFVRVRWRMGLPCPHCAFDPLLYKTNREEAVKRVKARLDDLKASGAHLLRQNNPFTHLPKGVVAKKENSNVKPAPRFLSREI